MHLSEVSLVPAQPCSLFSYLKVGLNWEGVVRVMEAGIKKTWAKSPTRALIPLPLAYTDLKNRLIRIPRSNNNNKKNPDPTLVSPVSHILFCLQWRKLKEELICVGRTKKQNSNVGNSPAQAPDLFKTAVTVAAEPVSQSINLSPTPLFSKECSSENLVS